MADTNQVTGVPMNLAPKSTSLWANPRFLVPALGVGYLIYNKKTRWVGLTIVGGFLYMMSQLS